MGRRLLTAFLLTLLVSPGYAQSLGDAAAREKAKRQKKGPPSAPVMTDEDLKATRPPGQSGKTGDSASSTPSSSTSGEGGSREGGSRRNEGREGESSSTGGNEAMWRERAQSQRNAIAAAEKAIQDNQDKLNRLMMDREPIALGDPNRLQTIERMKAETQRALEQAQLQRAEAQKALQDLEEEARRNNVPPGWLR
jgi:hypothetical protein